MEPKPLKVLMFGWEFPPEISGGLGTACYGLVSGLIDSGVDVTFVVPKLYGTEETDKFRLVGASDINVNFSNDHFNKNLEKVKYLQIHSHILPYVSPQDFLERTEFDVESLKIDSTFSTTADDSRSTGLTVPYSAKHMVNINVSNEELILISQNNEKLVSFKINK